MSVKNTQQTISSILEAFRKDFNKTAEETPVESVASAVEMQEDGGACAVKEAAEVPAESQVDAAESLKKLAEDYIESHDEALKKEAAIFGAIFADAFSARLSEKTAQEEELNKLAAEEIEMGAIVENLIFEKIAQVYDEAYLTVLQKLAGDIPLEELVAEPEASPAAEAVQAAAEAVQDVAAAARTLAEAETEAPAADPLPEEDVLPEEDFTQVSPEALEAALALAQGEEEGVPAEPELTDEDVAGIQDEAYANVLAQLQGQGA